MKRLLSIMLALAVIFTMSVAAFPQDEAYAETEGFFEVQYNKTAKTCSITKYTGDEIDVVIPNYLNGYKVTSINGFSDKEYMQTVKLPKYLTEIGSSCFSNCSNLKSLTIPGGVKTVSGIYNCESLEKVIIQSGVESIDCFNGCPSLKYVTLPDTLISISPYAFNYDPALTSITLPEGLKEIGNSAFCESGLKELIIPDSVTSIGTNVASYCKNLTKVSYGKKLTSISGANHCPSLTEIDFSRAINCRTIGEFAENTALTSITMPINLETIKSSAFSYCSSLTDVKLNNGLRVLGNDAFWGCPIKTLHFPKSFQGFDYESLPSGIEKVIMDGSIIDAEAMRPWNSNCTFEVYDNSQFLTYYRDGWKGSSPNGSKLNFVVKKSVPSTGLTLSQSSIVLWEGTPKKITATVTPSNSTDGVSWKSSDPSICYVNQNGRLIFEKPGSAVVTAKTVSGQIKQVNVICKNLPTSLSVVNSKGVKVSKTSITKGNTKRLKAIVDNGRTDVKVKWSSSDTSIAKVSSTGKITTYKRGTCKIYCKTEVGGLKKTITVTVK